MKVSAFMKALGIPALSEVVFELDMLLDYVNSALKRVEELLKGINNRSVSSKGSIRVEDHFSALNLRCIERLYGDHGLEVMETLRKSPSIALPVILIRMKQKQEEWIKCREDFNKALVAEIKETKEKSQKDDDVLYSVAARSRHSIVPHLEYDLTDKDIHVDLFKIIKYLCEEVCSTKEQVNQVLKLWTTFLEPMLYVPSRPENSDNVEDVEISTRGATKNKGKQACNGDDSVSPKRLDSSKVIMVNGGTLPKEDGSRVEKDFKNISIRDKARAVGVVKDNVLPRSSTELSGRDATPRPHNVHDDGHEAKSNIDDVPSSQQGDTSRIPPVSNGNFAKFEKEEGELSPNVYFDEADLATYVDHNGSNTKEKHSMEIDADADDEDSKNVLEGGDDVSGKSEGEAEGIEDVNFISADGTYSDHILLSGKPLAKRVASPLHNGGKKDCNVFYGNESFYALFRLHQVKTWLESEKDIRLGDWKAVEIEILNVFQLLTAKPVVYLESRQVEGYRNTIEILDGNNVVPLRSDTIRLVQNGCSFHGLRSKDPNQHLKDFLKLVDSLDLNCDNRERTHLCLFQFSLRDQASNWLERLPARAIST
ncbi:paired amphipathic helix protein Sin3-like protein 2 isoform X3 [Tanacetum coccineum]